jgi:biotin carboxyl carrier protein
MSRRYEVRVGDGVHAVELAGADEVRIEGRRYRLERLDPHRVAVYGDDGSRAIVSHAGTAVAPWVFAAGRPWRFDVAAAGARARAAGPADQDMTAPMPATVVTIAAPPGTRVSAGDPVVVLEAMKMELVIRAPRDGEVAAVHCSVGELVPPGTRLAELLP